MRSSAFLAAALAVVPLQSAYAQGALSQLIHGGRAMDMQSPPPAPVSDIETFGPCLALLLNVDRANQMEPVWPGYAVFGQPVLLYEAGVRSFLISHPRPPADYAGVAASPWTVFEKPGAIADLNFPFQFHRKVNGVDTFAYRYEPGDRPEREVRTLVHERFHVFQEKGFAAPTYAQRRSEPDAEDLALAALEQEALKRALLAPGSSEASRFVGHFLAARAERYSRFSDIRNHEVDEERSEGMALYVEEKLMDRAGVLPTAGGIAASVIRRLGRFPGMEDMDKGRYYGTGAAQGLLLDRAGYGRWKELVAAGSSLRDLSAAAYQSAGSLDEAKAEHGYSSMLGIAAKVTGDFQALKAKAISDYESSPGVEWKVMIPWDKDVNFGYSGSNPDFRLSPTETLMPNLSMLDVSGTAFSLHFEDRPAVLGSGVRFHAPVGAELLLDGTVFPLAEGVHPFDALELSGPDLRLRADRPGTLSVSGGKVTVSFKNPSRMMRSLLD